MPIYSYACECGEHEDIVKPMAESGREEACPACGQPMRRDLTGSFRTHADSYSRDLHSDALAIHPEQCTEHQRRYPDVPLDSACRPVLSSFKQAERYYRDRGIHKPQQHARRRATKIC